MNKPLYKEAWEQQQEYKKRGIAYCYNQRTKEVFLSVLAAPTFIPNVPYCQMVGHLILSGGVAAARKIDEQCLRVKHQFLMNYGNNPDLAQYAETITVS